MTENKTEYVLGVSKYELERLEFQHKVWKEVTDSFLDKIDVQKGWKILDVGAGPGFLSIEFLEKVGPRGEISALEPSDVYVYNFQKICKERYLSNYRIFQTNVESSNLPKEYYDFIFARWVIAFVPDPGLFLDKLVSALKPGGTIAFMDYAYEGLALYPRGGAFENAAESVKAYWRHGGGDPYIGAKLPKMFRERNITLTEYQPVEMAGGPSSGVFQWADKFFTVHFHQMAEMGVISTHDADEMLKDWIEHRENPDSIFFSPIIVNAAGRKD